MEIVITGDSSHTLYLSEIDECYHSFNGAVTESVHVFIHAGYNYLNNETLNIFEVGFGTGLNALLTLLECRKQKRKVNYYANELFPLEVNLIQKLNFEHTLFLNREISSRFYLMHHCEWEKDIEIEHNFKLHKIKGSILNIEIPEDINLVYFDAFSPQKQPEMWTNLVFRKLFEKMTPSSVLTTYCAKGEVKRALKSAGFIVENLPGPPGKREMIRAIKELMNLIV